MPGLFDGLRISKSGIMAHRTLQEVVGQNIANASNENYTRQEVRLTSGSTTFDGQHFLGQGVSVSKVIRVRDELLDDQLRSSLSTSKNYEAQLEWMQKIESVYNEPSDEGISAALNDFWEAWSELSNDPESFATRSNVISRTEGLTSLINNADFKLAQLAEEIDTDLSRSLDRINALLSEIAELNENIFQIEAGRDAQANDLHDKRDAAIDELSEMVEVSYHEAPNGMLNIFIGQHPAVIEDRVEELVSRPDTIDPSKVQVFWEFGDRLRAPRSGSLAGILHMRDTVIPSHRNDLDTLAQDIITNVNSIYANGVGMEGDTLMESNLGYNALGVGSANETLSILSSGSYGSMHISFYDANGDIVRSSGIVIDSGDSLTDIQTKLNNIPGLEASIITDPLQNDGRLQLKLDTISGANILGETSFAITDNTGGFDTSGFLSLMGLDQTAKSTNTSAAAPVLSSRDLTELQTVLGEPSVAAVRAAALGLAGSFTINAFETGTESVGKTDGNHVQQFTIDVTSTDSIDSIIAKINALTANYGMSASFNGGTNQIDFTSSARTDSEGNILLAGGTNYLRLSFANTYRYPDVSTDNPPAHYNGKGDSTGILAQMQLNTLFQGSDASNIALDASILAADDVNAGYRLASGGNNLAIDMVELQHARITGNNQFTIGEEYENIVAGTGTSIQQTEHLQANENLMLESFRAEKDRVSGVSLDEELANMVLFQRSYEANARAFTTFNQMAQEILGLIN